MRIGISIGSLDVLKRKKIKEDSPTTLYLLTLNKCFNSCSFCIQSKNVKKESFMLSRISWPPIDLEELEILLRDYNPFKRICIQVTNHKNWEDEIIYLISFFKNFNVPISVSSPIEDITQVSLLFQSGVDRVNISIDVANKEMFEKIKEKNWHENINLIKLASEKYPGKITTHIIIGLGETEKEVLELIKFLSDWNIKVALFAFTPLPGTPLENRSQPPLIKYRKIQLISFLLQNKLINFNLLEFRNDKLILTHDIIEKAYPFFSEIFKTSGCPDCNRPYYNESPRTIPYNYPRNLTKNEIEIIKNLFENDL